MTTKKKIQQSAKVTTEVPKAIPPATPKETEADTLIHLALRPTVQAGLTLLAYNKGFDERSIKTLVSDLDKQCELVGKGDLARAESMLTGRAHTLDAIFNWMARREIFGGSKNRAATEQKGISHKNESNF